LEHPPLKVSVIVPIRDTPQYLPGLLDALAAQTLPRDRFEVLIADDGSSPPLELPERWRDDGDWVRILPGPPQNSDAARNRAAAAARGEALAFLDGDCLPEPEWLENGIRALERADVIAGAVRFIRPEKLTVWALMDIDTTKDQERHVKLGYAETANLFVGRGLFEELGGYEDRHLYYGDFDFAQRAVAHGASLVYGGDALVWHPVRTDSSRFLRMVWRANRAYAMQMTLEGKQPQGLRLRNWLPLIQTYRGRRRAGRPFGLTADWFEQNGIQLRAADHVRALPALYLVVPYLSLLAQVQGMRDARRATARTR
jgi:glycosyltransferase involved in cell wall biosynthesis